MKRLLSIFLALLMLFSTLVLVSCEKEEDEEEIELELKDVQELVRDWLDRAERREFNSFKATCEEIENERSFTTTVAYDYGKDKSIVYWAEEESAQNQSRKLEEWIVAENEAYLHIASWQDNVDGTQEDGVQNSKKTSKNEFEEYVDGAYDEILNDEIADMISSVFDEERAQKFFVYAIQKGEVVEVRFDVELENAKGVAMITFKNGLFTKLESTEDNGLALKIAIEYDITIDVPEVE